MRAIKQIILHCSDSDIDSHDDISVIRDWHLKRNFNDVGYHFFIKKSGLIQRGRDIDKVGAHCAGKNKNSIGICLHGRDKFTGDQFISLTGLIKALVQLFPESTIHGHNEFSSKTCPNFDVTPYKTI